jgi:hypothetical protein
MDFLTPLNDFLLALFTFLNTLLNGLFGWLAAFFGGINVDLPTG